MSRMRAFVTSVRRACEVNDSKCCGYIVKKTLLNLVKSKQVEPEEAYIKSVEKKDMAVKLRGLGIQIALAGSEE